MEIPWVIRSRFLMESTPSRGENTKMVGPDNPNSCHRETRGSHGSGQGESVAGGSSGCCWEAFFYGCFVFPFNCA